MAGRELMLFGLIVSELHKSRRETRSDDTEELLDYIKPKEC